MKSKSPSVDEIEFAKAQIMAQRDQLQDAFCRIVGYCKKHVDCDSCRFKTQKYGCLFVDNSTPPCDWKMPQESEDE